MNKIEEFLTNKNSNIIDYTAYLESNCNFDNILVEEPIRLTFKGTLLSYKYKNKQYINFINFKETIRNCIFNDITIVLVNPLIDIKFEDCNFKTNLIIESTEDTKEEKIVSFILKGGEVNNLVIDKLTANYKFYINPQEKNHKESINIANLKINNSKFIENFKLHHAKIERFELEDIDFEKNADFFKSSFTKGVLEDNEEENTNKDDIGFKSINFKKLALFGDTKFFKKMVFRYVTFEGHNHFKSAELYEGIDLEYTNIQKEINFYGIDIKDKKTTSQETYRIIKHQFEKLGNKIEANKYHALELEQKRIELEEEKRINWKEYLVFKLHELSSEHSTNWFRALVWILVVGLVTNLLNNSMWYLLCFPMIGLIFYVSPEDLEKKLLIPIFLFLFMIFLSNELKFNDIFKYISILTKENNFNSNYFLMTLNKVSLGYLYYQFLMSVRKDTRK